MPVFLDELTKAMWLDPSIKFQDCLAEIIKSKVYEGLTFYQVGELVNSIKNDSEDCILPKEDYEEKLHKKGLGKYFTKLDKPT